MEAPPASPLQAGVQPPAPKKKRPSPVKVILLVLLGLTVLAGECATCTCLGLRSVQHAADQDAAARRDAPSVDAATLLSAYRAGQAAADATYKAKWIVVVGGQAREVKKTLGDATYLMVGTGKADEVPEVQCLLRADQAEKAGAVSKGQAVKVRGKVRGLVLNVVLQDCEILE